MARNRKSQSASSRFGPAIKACLLCLLIGGSGVGYVWQKDQLTRLGHQIRLRETRLTTLVDQNEVLRKQLAYMHSPKYLEKQNHDLNLGLVPPELSQIWSLPEPKADVTRPDSERHYAAQNDTRATLQ